MVTVGAQASTMVVAVGVGVSDPAAEIAVNVGDGVSLTVVSPLGAPAVGILQARAVMTIRSAIGTSGLKCLDMLECSFDQNSRNSTCRYFFFKPTVFPIL